MFGGAGRLCEALWFAAVGGGVPNAPRRGQDPSLRCKGYGVVMARWRAGHARPPRTAVNGLWTRGAREGGSPLLFPLTGCRGRLRAAYMPPLQSSDLKQRPSREQQPLKASGVRGRLAAHNERRQFASKLARAVVCPAGANIVRSTLTTPQCPAPTTQLGSSSASTRQPPSVGMRRTGLSVTVSGTTGSSPAQPAKSSLSQVSTT